MTAKRVVAAITIGLGLLDAQPGMAQTLLTTIPMGEATSRMGNQINVRSNGAIRVAILGSASFNVAKVDRTTVRFGANGTEASPAQPVLRDINGDGITDLTLRFRARDTGLQCGDTAAVLTGATFTGRRFAATDAVHTVGCR